MGHLKWRDNGLIVLGRRKELMIATSGCGRDHSIETFLFLWLLWRTCDVNPKEQEMSGYLLFLLFGHLLLTTWISIKVHSKWSSSSSNIYRKKHFSSILFTCTKFVILKSKDLICLQINFTTNSNHNKRKLNEKTK